MQLPIIINFTLFRHNTHLLSLDGPVSPGNIPLFQSLIDNLIRVIRCHYEWLWREIFSPTPPPTPISQHFWCKFVKRSIPRHSSSQHLQNPSALNPVTVTGSTIPTPRKLLNISNVIPMNCKYKYACIFSSISSSSSSSSPRSHFSGSRKVGPKEFKQLHIELHQHSWTQQFDSTWSTTILTTNPSRWSLWRVGEQWANANPPPNHPRWL